MFVIKGFAFSSFIFNNELFEIRALNSDYLYLLSQSLRMDCWHLNLEEKILNKLLTLRNICFMEIWLSEVLSANVRYRYKTLSSLHLRQK